jgi:hypothetical protein
MTIKPVNGIRLVAVFVFPMNIRLPFPFPFYLCSGYLSYSQEAISVPLQPELKCFWLEQSDMEFIKFANLFEDEGDMSV